jgi:Fic family protein
LNLSESKQEEFWRKFAIMFIFESNAIEGSRLSQKEVEAIVKKKYIKKTVGRKEILEVNNSIEAFKLIRSGDFILNQRSIINLHEIITKGLAVPRGYKKANIIVNNKETTPPAKVRESMRDLLLWRDRQKKKKFHPFILAAIFHGRFEYIHPFSDGNGRAGRLLFIWMLLKSGYGIMLFKNKNRQSYFSALNQADSGRPQKLYRHCVRVYKETMRGLDF